MSGAPWFSPNFRSTASKKVQIMRRADSTRDGKFSWAGKKKSVKRKPSLPTLNFLKEQAEVETKV